MNVSKPSIEKIIGELDKLSFLYKSKSSLYLLKDKGIILINSIDDFNKRKGEYESGIIISAENKYFEQFLNSRKYDAFSQKGYLFVPPGVRIERKSQKDIGFGVLGTANLSAGIIEILETLYGKDFEEVLKHETIHLMNWDKDEAWVRYETKKSLNFDTNFH